MAVDSYFSGDRVVRTTDELNIVEVARELGKANEAPGVRFAEIKTHEEKRVFVNPATVTYLQELGEDALRCPAARSGARRERGLPRPTPR